MAAVLPHSPSHKAPTQGQVCGQASESLGLGQGPLLLLLGFNEKSWEGVTSTTHPPHAHKMLQTVFLHIQ